VTIDRNGSYVPKNAFVTPVKTINTPTATTGRRDTIFATWVYHVNFPAPINYGSKPVEEPLAHLRL